MSSLAVLPPVGRDKSNSAVTKKSHVFQISNRGRISGWHGGQIRSPYSRLIMGVSSFTKPRLPGLFSWPANARHACPPRADGADITTAPPKRLRLRLRPPRQCGRPFLRKGILAALDAKKPAVDVAQQRSEEHTSELQSLTNLVCRLLLEKKKQKTENASRDTIQSPQA